MTQKGSSVKQTRLLWKRLDAPRRGQARALVAGTALMLAVIPLWVCADEVEMQNGDRYVGKVLSLNADKLIMQSEVLGTVDLPRGKVALITLGSGPPTAASARPSPTASKARAPSVARAAAATNPSPAMRQLGANTNLIRQIQKQFLGDAGPEANQKFEELLGGFLSGKVTMDDIRAQAQSAADQLRAMKRDSSESPGFAADTYLSILDQFLKETAPSASATNAPAASPASKPGPAQQDQ